jgi:hypothetical protein
VNKLPEERDLPAANHALRRDHLVSEITRKPTPWFRRPRWIAAFAGGLVIAGTGGAALASNTGGGSMPSVSANCYAAADANANVTTVDAKDGDPIATCAGEWRNGDVKPGVHTAPPLTQCRLRADAAGNPMLVIVPGDTTICAKIGMDPVKPATPEQRREETALGQVTNELVKRFTSRCVSEKDGLAYANERLAAQGLRTWHVKSQDFSTTAHCTNLAFDEPHRLVILTGSKFFH